MTAKKPESEREAREFVRARVRNDVPRARRCLRCETAFRSEGFGERICRRCKGLNSWRNGVAFSPGKPRGG